MSKTQNDYVNKSETLYSLHFLKIYFALPTKRRKIRVLTLLCISVTTLVVTKGQYTRLKFNRNIRIFLNVFVAFACYSS